MIVGLERLDRITILTAEQHGLPLQPVDFPPPRPRGPPSQIAAASIREESPQSTGAGSAPGSAIGTAVAGLAAAEEGKRSERGMSGPAGSTGAGLGTENLESYGERLASSAAAGPSYDAAGRDRVSAAVAAAAAMRNMREEHTLSQRAATLDSTIAKGVTLIGQV